jgi:hypothetical protein
LELNILYVSDIIGKPGRKVLRKLIESIREEHNIHFCIVNGENAAGGFGLVEKVVRQLFDLGIQVITSGNHIWDKKQFVPKLDQYESILRPANYPPGCPGKGYGVFETGIGVAVGVVNLQGRVFMFPIDCPFRVGEKIVEEMRQNTNIIIVDFHAEATSEKIALGWFLDGKVSAVIGSHTHVQTADERVLPKGTAYITDAGMTGGFDSVIGSNKKPVLKKFLMQTPQRFEPSKKDLRFNGVIVSIEPSTGKATNIVRVQRRM